MRINSFSAALLLGAAIIVAPLMGAQAEDYIGTSSELQADQTTFSAISKLAAKGGDSTSFSSFSSFSGTPINGAKRNSQFLTLSPTQPQPATPAPAPAPAPSTAEQPAVPQPAQPGVPQPAQPAQPAQPDTALEFFPLDSNGDGKTDAWGADRNGDGYYDVALIDENGDGQADYALFDDNYNGVIDAKFVPDVNINGKVADVYGFDDNEDGTFEYYGLDWNQDGTIDEFQPA